MKEEKVPDIVGIKQSVREMLGVNVHMNEFIFRVGVILLAFIRVGPSEQAIANFTGYSLKRGIVQRVLRRMREVGIYQDGLFRVEWLGEYDDSEDREQSQTVAFVLDCMVIDGKLSRNIIDGEFYYSLTDDGKEEMERLPDAAPSSY